MLSMDLFISVFFFLFVDLLMIVKSPFKSQSKRLKHYYFAIFLVICSN